MRSITATLLTVGTFVSLSVACNDRAEMGHGAQRRSGGNNVIPADFTNNVSADEFRVRAKQLAQGSDAGSLTLSPALESALALNAAESAPAGTSTFPVACRTLSNLTGGSPTATAIRELSLQTSFALTSGETGCSELVNSAGIDVFRTLNAVRFLADKMATTDSLTKDCVSMQPKAAGRRHALAWDLGPDTTPGNWLSDNNITAFSGEVTGAANGDRNALSAWVNLAGSAGGISQQMISSVNAFTDRAAGMTKIENIDEYRQGPESVLRKSLLSYDVAKGTVTETTTYESRKDGNITSAREISAVVSRTAEGLTLTLADSPDATGADATVEFSLDGNNALHCSVK